MNITQFIADRRETLLISDYNTYRAQLSRQLLATRKRLGRATSKREKFAKKDVTADDVGANHEFAHLLLLTAERAWAHAMHIKTSHTDDTSGRGITGPTRSHIVSRLAKAAKTAAGLVDILADSATSKAQEQDLLEARAYQSALAGSEEFEKQSGGQRSSEAQSNTERWQGCLQQLSQARVIYAALYQKDQKEIYQDLLTNTIDPTIRYAAYQARLSRTIPIPTVAKKHFPKEDKALIAAVEKLDQWALKDKPAPKTDEDKAASPQQIPDHVTWRGRRANIVDASIGQALANVKTAEARLKTYLAANPSDSAREKGNAYDDVLSASQDAADATKKALDELEKEKVDEGDARMQDLRVTSLAVNYDLVGWRVGRYRIMIGGNDGLTFEPQRAKRPKHLRKDGTQYPEKEEPRGHKLVRLRERNVLYDATIQSINSVRELRGAMRDEKFVSELDGQASYFRALKCLNIAYSHILLNNHVPALALLQRAKTLSGQVLQTVEKDVKDAPPQLNISSEVLQEARKHIRNQLARVHALVEMHKLRENSVVAASKNMVSAAPLVKNLHGFPTPGTQIDLTNLVAYPPKVEPVPVKPLFLDVAWNYIDYPGRQLANVVTSKPTPAADTAMVNGDEDKPQEKKRGWFGFGR